VDHTLKEKVVITYGTFDLFHIGHLKLLQRARDMGDRLIVGVSTDKFNSIKGKRTIIPFDHRAEIVASIRYVDKVISEESWEQKLEDVAKYSVDVLVMGDDWVGKFDFLSSQCTVKYVPRTRGVSTSQLKTSLGDLVIISPGKLREAMDLLNQLVSDLE
jgi:glycerol-3-phosphate cytidylyltransferase